MWASGSSHSRRCAPRIYEWEISFEPEVIRDLERLGATLAARRELTDRLWEDSTGA